MLHYSRRMLKTRENYLFEIGISLFPQTLISQKVWKRIDYLQYTMDKESQRADESARPNINTSINLSWLYRAVPNMYKYRKKTTKCWKVPVWRTAGLARLYCTILKQFHTKRKQQVGLLFTFLYKFTLYIYLYQYWIFQLYILTIAKANVHRNKLSR